MVAAHVENQPLADANATMRTKLRVLMVIPGQEQESSFVFARREAAGLAAAGAEVRTFFLTSRTSPLPVLRLARALRREISDYRPHLIHAHYGTMTSFLCAAVSKVPLVVTFRGSDLNGDHEVGAVRSGIGRLLSQLSCLRARQVICVARGLHAKLWWRRGRALVIPSGVDLSLFCPAPQREARARLGWSQDSPTVLFCGGERPTTKGLALAEEAVRLAQQAIGPIGLVVLEGRVPYNMMPCYLNAADCLALASLHEGSPSIVREAMACNLPVVATDVGDVAEWLDCVAPSRVVTGRRPDAFASALVDVLSRRCRSNGRERVAVCDEPRIVEGILSVYRATLESV
jgi:glycosyltransferase involved in cell wall biosynthesis